MSSSSLSSNKKPPHIPIMVDKVLKGFEGVELKTFYEGTLGAGGHAQAILKAHPEIGRYIACDKDPEAIQIAKEVLAPWSDKVEFVQGNFSDLDLQLKERGIEEVDGFFLTWECRQCS